MQKLLQNNNITSFYTEQTKDTMDTDPTFIIGIQTSERRSTRLSRKDYKELAGLKIKRKRGSSSEAVKHRKPRNPLPKTSVSPVGQRVVSVTRCAQATSGNSVPKTDEIQNAHFNHHEFQNLKKEDLIVPQEGTVNHSKPDTSGGDATVARTTTENDKASHIELRSRKRGYSALAGIKTHDTADGDNEPNKAITCSTPAKKVKTTNISRLTQIKQRRRGRSRNTVSELVEESVNNDVITTPANIKPEETAKPPDALDGADDILLPKQEEVNLPIDMTDTPRSWHEDEFYLNDPPVHRSKAGRWGSSENREIERLHRIKLEKERVNNEWKKKHPRMKLKTQKVQKEAEKLIDDRYHTEATARYNRRQEENLKVIRNVYTERGLGAPPETDDMRALVMELKRRVYLKQMVGEGYRIDGAMEQESYDRVSSNLAYVTFENGFGAGVCPVKKQGEVEPRMLMDRQEILKKQRDLEQRRESELGAVFRNSEQEINDCKKINILEQLDLLNNTTSSNSLMETNINSFSFVPNLPESKIEPPCLAQTTDIIASPEVNFFVDEQSNCSEYGSHAKEDTTVVIPALSSRKSKRKGHASVGYINIHPYDAEDYFLPKRARGCSEDSISEVVYRVE